MAMAAVLAPSTTASANHGATLTVPVGMFLDSDGGPPAESMRFFPDEVSVHRGDTLKFMGEFHTATLLPTSVEDPGDWTDENATEPEDPYAFLKPNPDNARYPLKLLGDNPFTPRADCGSASNPCLYSGDEVVDSGTLFAYADPPADENSPPTPTGFSVTIDAQQGDVVWVICRMHTRMTMKITVVGNNEDSTSQADIDSYVADTVAADRAEASSLHESMSNAHPSHMQGGKRVWEAYSGFDTETISLYDMYPARINIRRGDKIEWRFDSLGHEVHTVTFSGKRARRFANNAFAEVCDPNGDDESGGETPIMSFPPMCDEGVHESLIAGRMVGEVGDGAVRGARDLANSGARGAGLPKNPYVLKFPRKTDGYVYLCAIHPFMRGKVTFR
jgi:plastocyanin